MYQLQFRSGKNRPWQNGVMCKDIAEVERRLETGYKASLEKGNARVMRLVEVPIVERCVTVTKFTIEETK